MKAEQFFRQLIYIDRQIDSDLEELEKIKAMMTCIPSPKFEPVINGKGGHCSRVENIVQKFFDLQQRITDEIDDLVDKKREAMAILQRLENQQQRIILQDYYIGRKSLELIAAEMYLSYRRVQEIKREGLAEAQKIMDRTKDSV